jgi:glucose-1-phosphate adenylyltransferase
MQMPTADSPAHVPSDYSRSACAVIMAGGDGKRLRPLTQDRAKPAVPFGAIYRIIDFTLSNCINSNIRKGLVLTQYKSDSLNRHLARAWGFLPGEMGEFIWNMPPQKRVGDTWYQGTADSVYQNFWTLKAIDPKYVAILSADHIYKMDYRRMLDFHNEVEADVVIATTPIPQAESTEFGVVEIDESYRIKSFKEKIPNAPTIPGQPGRCLANMGIYTFPSGLLYDVLEEFPGQQKGNDFGHDILPALVARGAKIYAWPFEDENHRVTDADDRDPGEELPATRTYWRDVGTLDAYYEANLDLCSVDPEFNLYDPIWPVRTIARQLAPAKFVFADSDSEGGRRGEALDSIVAAGCIISGGKVRRSLLSPQVRVNSWATVENSILMDRVDVGRNVKLRNTIVDKYVHIPSGIEIGFDPEADRKRGLHVTESGITVIGRAQHIPAPATQISGADIPGKPASESQRVPDGGGQPGYRAS